MGRHNSAIGQREVGASKDDWQITSLSAPVLVVDDDNIVVEILASLVVRLGFEDIEFASEGSAALELLNKQFPI